MITVDTAVHDHCHAAVLGAQSRWLVDYTLLNPNDFQAQLEAIIHHPIEVLGAAKNVDQICAWVLKLAKRLTRHRHPSLSLVISSPAFP